MTAAPFPQPQDPGLPYGTPPSGPSEPPLEWPWYGISFLPAIRRGYRKYAVFAGRASRGEFWWWVLGQLSIYVVLGAATASIGVLTADADGSSHSPLLFIPVGLIVLWLFGSIVPDIAISVRRLHDAGNSGALYWLNAIPYVGSFVVLILCMMQSSPTGKRFDPPEAGETPPPGMNTFPDPGAGWVPWYGYPPPSMPQPPMPPSLPPYGYPPDRG